MPIVQIKEFNSLDSLNGFLTRGFALQELHSFVDVKKEGESYLLVYTVLTI